MNTNCHEKDERWNVVVRIPDKLGLPRSISAASGEEEEFGDEGEQIRFGRRAATDTTGSSS
jgi:hypothetical protein